MPSLIRAAVTGAPGGGKTTLLTAVAAKGIAVGEEVARQTLQARVGMALRDDDPLGFAEAMLEAQLESWHAVPEAAGTILFDRGFPDIVGFLRLEGLSVPAALDKVCRTFRYNGPIFRAPAWSAIYRQDAERIQSWEEAVASDEAVTSAWRDYGFDPVRLPEADPATRAEFVMERL